TMLTADGCAGRRRRLREALPAPCDLILVADPQHLIYLADYAPSPFAFRANDAAALLVLGLDGATLVADNLMRPDLDAAHVDRVEALAWYEGKKSAPPRAEHFIRSALDVLARVPGRRVGVEMGRVPAGVVEGLRDARPGVEFVEVGPTLRRLRRAKD